MLKRFPNDHLINVIIQKIKIYLNYSIKQMQRNSFYTKNNGWFDNISRKVKQGLLKKTKLTFSVIVLSKNKQSLF